MANTERETVLLWRCLHGRAPGAYAATWYVLAVAGRANLCCPCIVVIGKN